MSVCVDCGNTGLVEVPHPDYVRLGEWLEHHKNAAGEPVRITATVTCGCAKGQTVHADMAAKAGLDKGPMTLERYHRVIDPDPKRILARYRREDRDRRGTFVPEKPDSLFSGKVVQNTAAGFGTVPQ